MWYRSEKIGKIKGLFAFREHDGGGTLFIGSPKWARPRVPREMTPPTHLSGFNFPLIVLAASC